MSRRVADKPRSAPLLYRFIKPIKPFRHQSTSYRRQWWDRRRQPHVRNFRRSRKQLSGRIGIFIGNNGPRP